MLKIGIIGAGRIGRVHGESIQKYVSTATIKSIADPYLNEEIVTWAKELEIPLVLKDYKEIINDPEIDAVLICSSTDTHSQISIEAAKKGKHIFCEKPVDKDLNKIKEVINIIEETGVKYQVGFNRRFDSNFMALREAVDTNKIGKPRVIKITSRDPAPPPIDYIKVSGGMFLDMTIHDFDMIRFLSKSEAKSIYAVGKVFVDEEIGKAGDIDTAIITVTMENGCMCVIDNCREASYGYDQRAEIFGSEGSISINNNSYSTAILSNKDGVIAEKPLLFFLERYMEAYALEIKEFVKSIVNDTKVPVSIIDGLEPIKIAIAAKKSLEERRVVNLR
ncbi:MAG: inositol 2-dehydrogenase [Lachnospirales bacterium]